MCQMALSTKYFALARVSGYKVRVVNRTFALNKEKLLYDSELGGPVTDLVLGHRIFVTPLVKATVVHDHLI